ncbi:FeoB-associated Cys-rich membrane protein [Bacillus sp. HMF5848]|uniref:FeoB-associated Cys-rich membrane protein n=1 Tax=Bacillus sp. HMF5848 TaxID=2495421 RepID=UPI000F77AF6B|nr:FeoB-associated Cys-rich membrane protein [Bacillus sp. HMF5848]RSK26445.1 FeoB-associated Cys-rich membrane protein [Bacillus sp. HMF5848]
MLVNVAIGAVVFGYAGFTLYRFVKNSSKGKCAACELSKNCSGSSCAVNDIIK